MRTVAEICALAPVIPVITVERLEHAAPLARALVAGGLRALEVTLRTPAALAAIRAGDGPRFIECDVYRWREHVGPNEDFDGGYRAREDAAPWHERDQVARLAAMVPDAARAAVEAEVDAAIADAVAFAEQSPFPPPEELLAHVFAD